MTARNEINNFITRLSALEIRMASVEASLNNLVGVPGTRKSKKMSVTEKDQMKKKLLRGMPYDKRRIEKLNLTELRMLASAIKINSFGIKRDELINAILAGQKKKSR